MPRERRSIPFSLYFPFLGINLGRSRSRQRSSRLGWRRRIRRHWLPVIRRSSGRISFKNGFNGVRLRSLAPLIKLIKDFLEVTRLMIQLRSRKDRMRLLDREKPYLENMTSLILLIIILKIKH